MVQVDEPYLQKPAHLQGHAREGEGEVKISDTDLATLEELHAKATPGEWEAGRHCADWNFPFTCFVRTPNYDPAVFGDGISVHYGAKVTCIGGDAANTALRDATWADAQFIAAARNAIPALVAEVRGLRKELADLREQLATDVESAYREGWGDARPDGAPYTQDTDWRASYAKQRLDGAGEG
jgi:hypothetical protein